MKLTGEQIGLLRQVMRGQSSIISEDVESAGVDSRGKTLNDDVAPFLASGLLTTEELEKGKRRYVLTSAGRAAVGTNAVDDTIKTDAKRAYLIYRGSSDLAPPAWDYLSDAMQNAFVSVYRTAFEDAARYSKTVRKT